MQDRRARPPTPQIEKSRRDPQACPAARAGGAARRPRRDPQPRHASAAASRSPTRRRNIRPARSRWMPRFHPQEQGGERTGEGGAVLQGPVRDRPEAGRAADGGRIPGGGDVGPLGVPRTRPAPRRLRHHRARGAQHEVRLLWGGGQARSLFKGSTNLEEAKEALSRKTSNRRPISTTRPPPSCTSPASCWNAHGTRSRHHADRQRHGGEPARARAAAPDRFPARGARPDRLACRLRARRLRRLHGARRRRDRARLPDARGAGRTAAASTRSRGCRIRRRLAELQKAFHEQERAAMRLLHARAC